MKNSEKYDLTPIAFSWQHRGLQRLNRRRNTFALAHDKTPSSATDKPPYLLPSRRPIPANFRTQAPADTSHQPAKAKPDSPSTNERQLVGCKRESLQAATSSGSWFLRAKRAETMPSEARGSQERRCGYRWGERSEAPSVSSEDSFFLLRKFFSHHIDNNHKCNRKTQVRSQSHTMRAAVPCCFFLDKSFRSGSTISLPSKPRYNSPVVLISTV